MFADTGSLGSVKTIDPTLDSEFAVQISTPRSHRALIWLLYSFATLQFIRFYVVSTRFYLKMPAYLSGHERLPFQERILPVMLMWPINHSAIIMRAAAHHGLDPATPSAASPGLVAFYLVSLIAFSIAGFYVVALYRALTSNNALAILVYPVFMVVALWTYVVHLDANYSYPYDMPSLAFFTAGLYYIYTRRFLPLLLVVFIGTLNRETTLFLIGIFLIDSATQPHSAASAALRERFSLSRVSWPRVAALAAAWLVVKLPLAYHFAHNNASESYIRIAENIHRLQPRLLPSLLNICGYLLPVVWVLRRRLHPTRFANYIYILPVWLAVMFVSGVILETRIYGELTAFTAVAVVLLLEEHVLRAGPRMPRHVPVPHEQAERELMPEAA